MIDEDLKDLLHEVVEFLDDYTDAEYEEGIPRGNRAMNLQCRVIEILEDA